MLLCFLCVQLCSSYVYTGEIGNILIDPIDPMDSLDIDGSFEMRTLKSNDNTYICNFDNDNGSAPPVGSFASINGVLENGILYSHNYTVLSFSNNEIDIDEPIIIPRNGNRSLGVFFLNMTGDLCGYSGSPCRYCWDLEDVRNFFYKGQDNVSDFYSVMSEGKLNLIVNESSVFNVKLTDSPTDLYGSIDQLIFDSIGVNPRDYDHHVFLFPDNWWRVPPLNSPFRAGVGETPGSRTYIISCRKDSILHELGHNFDFGHANAFSSKNGDPVENGDSSSVMGWGSGYNYKRGINSIHRYNSGWIAEKNIVRVNVSDGQIVNDSWQLEPLVKITENTKVMIVTSGQHQYFIEYREKISYDSHLASSYRTITPSGNYYDAILVRYLDIVNGYRKDTRILAVIQLDQYYNLAKNVTIVHTGNLGNVSILGYYESPPAIPASASICSWNFSVAVILIVITLLFM